MAEKAKEGYESDVSDLEEDDNIIDDLLQSDDTYSGNRYQLVAVDLLLSLACFSLSYRSRPILLTRR